MSSKTEIANRALSHLGTGRAISNIDTEKSEDAAACRIFFSVALETILRKRDWWFARKRMLLDYVGTDPTGVWGAVFRYPNDCVMIRRCGYPSQVLNLQANYAMAADDQGSLIYCQDKSAYFEYTFRNEATETYPKDFESALSFLLAYLVAPRLTGGDPFKMGQLAYQAYEMMVNQAAVSSFNEEGPKAMTSSAFQDVRNS